MTKDFDELPKMAGWHEANLVVPKSQVMVGNLKPNYNLTFYNNRNTSDLGKQVGKLDFNGPQLVFEGDAEASAKVFIDWIASSFKGRFDEEYKRGYEDAKQNKDPQR